MADGTPYHDAGGGDAEELGAAVAAGVAYLRALTGAGLSVDEAFGQIEFRLAVNADQFSSIAKLRAMRRLWARVAEVSGASEGTSARVHAVTSAAMMTRRDPWVNMLRTTVAAFAAGAAAPTRSPCGRSTPASACRTASPAASPATPRRCCWRSPAWPASSTRPGGSWYAESLTEGVAQAAWTWFTEIEKAGAWPPP